jgi:hypothetical protein
MLTELLPAAIWTQAARLPVPRLLPGTRSGTACGSSGQVQPPPHGGALVNLASAFGVLAVGRF